MRMKAGIREALALVLAEEATVAQHDVINLITGTLAVQAVPFLCRLLTLPDGEDRRGVRDEEKKSEEMEDEFN